MDNPTPPLTIDGFRGADLIVTATVIGSGRAQLRTVDGTDVLTKVVVFCSTTDLHGIVRQQVYTFSPQTETVPQHRALLNSITTVVRDLSIDTLREATTMLRQDPNNLAVFAPRLAGCGGSVYTETVIAARYNCSEIDSITVPFTRGLDRTVFTARVGAAIGILLSRYGADLPVQRWDDAATTIRIADLRALRDS